VDGGGIIDRFSPIHPRLRPAVLLPYRCGYSPMGMGGGGTSRRSWSTIAEPEVGRRLARPATPGKLARTLKLKPEALH